MKSIEPSFSSYLESPLKGACTMTCVLTCVNFEKRLKVAHYSCGEYSPAAICFELHSFLTKLNVAKFIAQLELLEDISFINNSRVSDVEHDQISGISILKSIQSGKDVCLNDDSEESDDYYFTRWIYFLDLDSNTFEIYRGNNETQLTPDERYYSKPVDQYGLHPHKLVAKFDLHEIPSLDEFVEIMKETYKSPFDAVA